MRFKITGANAESGDDVDVMLEAPSRPDVEKLAHDKGIMVASITVLEAPHHAAAPNHAHAPHPAAPGNGHAPHPAAHGHAPAAHAPAPHAPAVPHKKVEDLSAISLVEDEDDKAGKEHAHGVITVNANAPSGSGQSSEGHINAEKKSEAAMEYHIMMNQSLYLLETAVNRHIHEGWEPQGGVSISTSNNALQYFQALVRKKKVT